MPMEKHVHMLSGKYHPFHFQTEALFERAVETQPDGAAGADDALPGERTRRVCLQQPGDCAVQLRIARRGRHGAIGCYAAPGDEMYYPPKRGIPHFRGLSSASS